MAKKKKYYAVWKGRRPGVYGSWEACQRQVSGYPDAQFKSFPTREMAEKALSRPRERALPSSTSKKKFYYVVWHGKETGVFTDWESVRQSIKGVNNPIYKTFGSRQLAEKALTEHPDNYKDGHFKKTTDLSEAAAKKIGRPVELSLSVDAACNHRGQLEYQGTWTFSRETVFRQGPYSKGTNNIGEFLAIVHALAYLDRQRDEQLRQLPVYSDSRIAIGWVSRKKCRTQKRPSPELQELIRRAEVWLHTHTYTRPLLKWETKAWGEIPADFGRK